MWFQNKRLSLYWIENQLSVWLKMVITPNTPDIHLHREDVSVAITLTSGPLSAAVQTAICMA